MVDIEYRIEAYKPYQKIIDEVTIEECIEMAKGIEIVCNRDEMIREAIIQRLAKSDKESREIDINNEEMRSIIDKAYNQAHEDYMKFKNEHQRSN